MKYFNLLVLPTLAAALLFVAAPKPASATTLGFESLGTGNTDISVGTTFDESGYKIVYTPGPLGFVIINTGYSDTPTDGTNALYSYNSGSVTISALDGSNFSLSSFDAAQAFKLTVNDPTRILDLNVVAGGGGPTANFTSSLSGGAVFNTYSTPSFTDVSSVTFVGVAPYPTVEFALDNIVLSSAVPEASTWAMMVLGFAGLGFMAYRRKNKPSLM